MEAGNASSQRNVEVLRHCDFRDFIRYLGVDPQRDVGGLVMVAAHHAFATPLPPQWSEQIDDATSRLYFFNETTGESAWSHPQEATFRELIDEVKCWKPDAPVSDIFARSDAHLRAAHARAAEAVAGWSGPFAAPRDGPEESPEGGEVASYYFNASTGESCWEDPRQTLQQDLQVRHSVLCECVRGHAQTLAQMGPDSRRSATTEDSSEGEEDPDDPRVSMRTVAQSLWQSLPTLSLALPQPQEEPPAQRADGGPQTPTRGAGAHRPAGDDTVRSTMSYLTARSTTSQAGE